MNCLRPKTGSCLCVLAAAACALLVCLPAFSQGNVGRILGSVTDQSGAAIAGATVTVLDVQRGIPRTLASDQSGEYVAPSLLPGAYTVRAEYKGFKSVERQNIMLEVGQDIRVDLSLQPGEQSQTITVTEELPQIETTNATLGGTLSNETINDLPLNGRSYQNLLTLRPGMMIYPGGGGWTMSTNGTRPEENQFILDGLTNDNPLQGLTIINGPGVAGDAATIMPIDAIQEVKIEENPKAEYGGKAGAVVNVGIKSGTNSVHGTAYAFGRDGAWDARDYFNAPPATAKPVELEQYGATVGGPIKKDKLFFFMGYEAESYSVGNQFTANVPEDISQATGGNPADPAHSAVDAITAIQNAAIAAGGTPQLCSSAVSANCLSSLSLHLLGCTGTPAVVGSYACTGGLFPTNDTNSPAINQGFPSSFRSDNGVLKIDYHINDQNTLNGMYFQSAGLITAEDVVYLQPQWLSQQQNRPRVAGASWTWTPNSRWVNSARFGFVRMNRMSQQVDSDVSPTTYGINTGVTITGSLPIIRLSHFTSLGGSPGWPYKFGPDTVYQFVDYVSYVRGNHAFKFGGDIRRNLADPSQFGAAKGAINFRGGSSLTNFIEGMPTFATIQSGDPARQLRQWSFAGSIQDDWRVAPRLILNLGLRYDYTTPMSEANNLLGGFDPTLGMVQVGKQISSLYKGDHTNFAPRLGLAWDITGKGTTVVRAGAGIIYDSLLPMQTFTGVAGNAVNVSGGVTTVPTGATIVVNGVPTPGSGTIAVSNVTIPSGAAGAPGSLISNWQNNSSTVPLFSGANTVECGDGSNDTAGNPTSPCALAVMDHNFKSPYITTWTLGIQHALTNNLSMDISYVGNHGTRLNGIKDINQPPVGAGYPGAGALVGTPLSEMAWCNANSIVSAMNIPTYMGNPITCGGGDVDPNLVQAALPFNGKFPYLGPILVLSNLYRSNYNGLQATPATTNFARPVFPRFVHLLALAGR